jgi:peptidoglycan/LPS O-acetylase OafA/YrhL
MGMTWTLRMRRSRGVISGSLLLLLGLWGALIPFIGPYFNYAYTPDTTWTYNTARLWLEILPGAATFLAGLLLIVSAGRHIALFGALLGAAAGAWFALGTVFSPLWNHSVPMGGTPVGSTATMRIAEQVGFFTGLGVVVVFIAAAAFGRILSLPAETAPAPVETVPPETQPVG